MSIRDEPVSGDRRALLLLAGVAGLAGMVGPGWAAQRVSGRGLNLIETANAPYGSAAAARSLEAIASLGANCVAIIPFLWQAHEHDPRIVYGDAVPPARLRLAIRQAHAAGLRAIVKPHVWVPERWAGSVRMRNAEDWARWFAAYRSIVVQLAELAQDEGADTLIIGTELRQTTGRNEWDEVIGAARERFSGRVSYVAHGTEEAERIGFWHRLDAISMSLYPPLGPDSDRERRRRLIQSTLAAAHSVAQRSARPLCIAEIGVRSARGAAMRPWESAEERIAEPDPALQRAVLGDWLDAIDVAPADGVLVWRWFTDPGAGGMLDTDFTVQNKPAEHMLRARWLRS
ncbi:hypothetical protein B2G71_21970 [Novosphingobium sp. PC22D]|nr:hypothetical protein B2G71_21970 [Novosphingobium sp. PC22D]